MKKKIALAGAIAFLILFLAFTVLVITVDIQPIGPNGSEVGLATINGAVADVFEYNDTWYTISEYAGYIALAIVPCFACLGLFQAIKRKSIAKVDRQLFILASFYALVACTYVFFELITVNYRPILINGELEASFPSSHTMLSLCITSTTVIMLHALLKNRKTLLIVADVLCIAVGATVILGRLASGVHWLSDIIAGILISGALVCFFIFASLLAKDIAERKQSKQTEENTVND